MTQAAKQTDDHEDKDTDTKNLFYKAENRLFHAKTVKNKATGEVVKMTNNVEKLYTYMLSQYKWYKSIKRPFAESQVRLGTMARIGDAVKKTKRYIDELVSLGLVTILDNDNKKGVCDVYKVFEVDKVADNLVFTYPEFEDKPLYDHEKRLGKDNNRANQTAQQAAPQAQQEQHPLADADEPAPDEDATPNIVDCVDQSDKPFLPEIFDQNGVITEAFIRRSGADLNEDGTLKSGWYVYACARAEQARREGLSDSQIDDALESYRAAAKPEYIPQHLHSPTWATLPEQQNQQSQPTEAA